MDLSAELGPLAALAGIWEGDQGVDLAYSHSRDQAKETPFRERITFEPFGPVENGEQVLFGLDYTTKAWPIGEADPFHMEVGYWLWDAASSLVMRCFMVPRGVTVLAGGTASADARELRMSAEAGSGVFGVLNNPHLDAAAKTVRYALSVRIGDDGSFSYEEDTVLDFQGQSAPFHHTDQNTLKKV